MFEYILGKLAVKKVDYVALEINGLAYKIHISLKTFEKIDNIGSNEKLYIYTNVKEDDILSMMDYYKQKMTLHVMRVMLSKDFKAGFKI